MIRPYPYFFTGINHFPVFEVKGFTVFTGTESIPVIRGNIPEIRHSRSFPILDDLPGNIRIADTKLETALAVIIECGLSFRVFGEVFRMAPLDSGERFFRESPRAAAAWKSTYTPKGSVSIRSRWPWILANPCVLRPN